MGVVTMIPSSYTANGCQAIVSLMVPWWLKSLTTQQVCRLTSFLANDLLLINAHLLASNKTKGSIGNDKTILFFSDRCASSKNAGAPEEPPDGDGHTDWQRNQKTPVSTEGTTAATCTCRFFFPSCLKIWHFTTFKSEQNTWNSKQCKLVCWMCLTLLPPPNWNCRNLLLVWRNRWRVSFRYVGHCPCYIVHCSVSVFRCATELRSSVQDFDLPSFNKTFMANLEGLKKNIQEEEWKVSRSGGIANNYLYMSHWWIVDVILLGFFFLHSAELWVLDALLADLQDGPGQAR